MVLPKVVGAILGVISSIVAFACILLAIVYHPSFSWTNNALSDLGIVEGLTSIIFNTGLIVAGVLTLAFSVLSLYPFVRKTRSGKFGVMFFAATSMALILIGIFNESFVPIHLLVSVAFFILAPISLFILTYSFYSTRQNSLAISTLLTGVIAALAWILQFAFHYVTNVAVPETISGFAVSVWIILLAIRTLKQDIKVYT